MAVTCNEEVASSGRYCCANKKPKKRKQSTGEFCIGNAAESNFAEKSNAAHIIYDAATKRRTDSDQKKKKNQIKFTHECHR